MDTAKIFPLKTLRRNDIGIVRYIEIDNERWFVVADIALVTNYTSHFWESLLKKKYGVEDGEYTKKCCRSCNSGIVSRCFVNKDGARKIINGCGKNPTLNSKVEAWLCDEKPSIWGKDEMEDHSVGKTEEYCSGFLDGLRAMLEPESVKGKMENIITLEMNALLEKGDIESIKKLAKAAIMLKGE